ncbi:hypothetical protein [Arthrobacter sp. KK5.5]|uniref:hypothetical protein n=1 Tax=Arthrobacter sp. KK5.5 TaxID=3373084 RepID=UPI003EE6EA8B
MPNTPGEHLLGTPMESVLVPRAAFTSRREGTVLAVMVASGGPGRISVIDVRTGRRVATRDIPGDGDGSVTVWAMGVDPATGLVALGTTGGRAFLLDPETSELSELPRPPAEEPPFFERSVPVGDGGFLFTSYPEGRLYRYHPEGRRWTDYGRFGDENSYSIGLDVRGDYAYVGTGTADPAVFRVGLTDGAVARIDLPAEVPGAPERDFVYDVVATVSHLFARVQSEDAVYVRDLRSGRWVDRIAGAEPGLVATEPNDGVYWADSDQRVRRYVAELRESTALPEEYAVSQFRGGATFGRDGGTNEALLVTVNASGRILGWDAGIRRAYSQSADVAPGALRIRALAVDPGGQILVSALATMDHVRHYDPRAGTFGRLASMGQIESFGVVDGRVLGGGYPGASLQILEPRDSEGKGRASREEALRIPQGQDRPVSIVAVGPGIAAVASTPAYGQQDGALSIVDLASGAVSTYRGLVPGQSPLCLAASGSDHLYVGTGAAAGLGADPSEEDGRVLRVDAADGRILASTVPAKGDRNIAALLLDAAGWLWGLSSNSVFRLDPETLDVLAIQRYSDFRDAGSYVTGRTLADDGGAIYACAWGDIHQIDKRTLARTKIAEGTHLVRTADGDLYYSRGARLYRRILA